jgi:uncharacterized protein YpmS
MVIFMITAEEHQKTLSAKGINLPVAEVQKLLDLQYKLANLFFNVWSKQDKVIASVQHSKVVIRTKNGNACLAETFSITFYSYAR